MIYLVRCEHPQGIEITTLGITLKKGDAFDCPKHIYDKNREIKSLISAGIISIQPKLPVVQEARPRRLVAHTKTPAAPRQQQVVHKTEVHHHESSVDLDGLAAKLLEKLSGVLSPEMIAQAVASQIPQQQVVVQQANPQQQGTQFSFVAPSEELTFIPSKIISDDVKSSTKSNVSESSGQDSDLGDALAALRAMRKAQK